MTALPEKPSSSTSGKILPPFLLVLLTIAAMWSGLKGAPIFDDIFEIINNPNIHTLSPWWKPLTGGNELPARPLPYLSFAVDYKLWRGSFAGFHATNIFIHCVAVLCLYGIVRRTLTSASLRERFGTHATSLAFLIAALWGVHPLQTQAVTYVYQRMESMMGMFVLLSLYLFVRGSVRKTPRPWLVTSVLACAGAMASKEVAVVLPILILSYDRIFVEASFASIWRRRWAYYLSLAATWAILALAVFSQGNGGIFTASGAAKLLTESGTTPLTYLLSQPGVILHYLRLAVWPVGQCFDLAWPISNNWLQILPPLAIIASLLVVSLWALWRGWALGWLGFAFFLILAPTSSVLPMAAPAVEHRMYLPLAPVLAALVLGIFILCRLAATGHPGSRHTIFRSAAILASITVLALALATDQRNRLYWNPALMWRDNTTQSPTNDRAWTQLWECYFAEGDLPAAQEAARRAVDINPANVRAHANLGGTLLQLGQVAEAIDHLKIAVSSSTEVPPPGVYLLFASLVANSEPALSDMIIEKALTHHPDDIACLNNGANHFARKGRYQEAIALYERALALNPSDPTIHQNMAEAQRLLNQP